MKTAEEIVDLMAEEMPFKLNPDIVPYIIEAMKLYANQKLDEAYFNVNLIHSFDDGQNPDLIEEYNTPIGSIHPNLQSILSLKDQI